MPADKALVILPGVDYTNNRPLSPYRQNPERYDKGWVHYHTWDAKPIPERIMQNFLDGLDVVYAAETVYDFNFYNVARRMGVKICLHVNPEFYPFNMNPDLPRPDAFWYPSPWLTDRLPPGHLLPFPVNRSVLPYRHRTSATSFLHIVGHQASRDRNGTSLVFKALRRVRTPVNALIRSQDPVPNIGMPRNVKLQTKIGDIPEYTDLYTEGDVMIYPRRYGGNALPLHEALSCGIPVLMTDCSPQSSFLPPEMRLGCYRGGTLRSQLGPIQTYDATPMGIAQRIDELVNNPEQVAQLSKEADRLAESISWETMRGKYKQAFEDAIEGVVPNDRAAQD